jgi:hypothetical protein
VYYYIGKAPLIACFVFAIAFLIFRYSTRRIRISEFDSLGVLNITVALSAVLLIGFFLGGYVRLSSLIQIIILIFSFYLGIHLISLLFASTLKIDRSFSAIEIFACDNLRGLNLVVMFLCLMITGGILNLLLFKTYGSPDERLLVAKANRAIDIIRIGVSSVFPYYAIGLYLLTKHRIYLLFVFMAVMVGFFSGSKSFILSYIVVYFTLDGLFHGKRSIKLYFKSLYLFGVFIASAVGVKMFWGGTVTQSLMGVWDAILSAGDIYYYAFIIGDYTKLFEKYNLLSYISHPFTSIIGIRGYEWPIGALIRYTGGLEVTGAGPNPHLPILAMVLMKGNYFASLLFAFVIGCFVCISRIYALKIIGNKNVPPYWRLAIFSVFFGAISSLYIDIGSFQFQLIGVLFVTLMFSMFYEIVLGLRYTRKKATEFGRLRKHRSFQLSKIP